MKEKKNLFYIIFIPNWKNRIGVINKIHDQIHQWINNSNFNISIIYISKSNIAKLDNLNCESTRIPYNSKKDKIQSVYRINAFLKDQKVDLIYVRSIVPIIGFQRLMKCYNVIVEINSVIKKELDLKRERKQISKINYLRNIWAFNLHKYAKGFVGVTAEAVQSMSKFNKKSIVIPNSIDIRKSIKRTSDSDKLKFFFIGSSNQDWHGVDKIIKFGERNEDRVEIHIIGISDSTYNSKSVFFHGYKTHDEIDVIIKNCHIAFSTMALHRMNMSETSPLKTREYLAKGFPTILGYKDSMFNSRKVPEFVLEIPNEESNVVNNDQKIIEFARNYKDYIVSRSEVYNLISSDIIEKRRLHFFEKIIQNNSI